MYVARDGGATAGTEFRTDARGQCDLRGLPGEGKLFAMIRHDNGVRAGVPIERVDQEVLLDGAGSLRVRLRSPEGSSLQGANCMLVDRTVWRVIAGPEYSDANGFVLWEGLHPGTYLFQVREEGREPKDVEVVVEGAEELDLSLGLR